MNDDFDPCNATNDAPVSAVLVPEAQRLSVLPRHFGRLLLVAEATVYVQLDTLCSNYQGGFWHFYNLSNGGFYMAPASDKPMHLAVEGNGFSGSMSADAAGIVACLFAFWNLSFRDERFAVLYHQLRAYAGDHPECVSIFDAID